MICFRNDLKSMLQVFKNLKGVCWIFFLKIETLGFRLRKDFVDFKVVLCCFVQKNELNATILGFCLKPKQEENCWTMFGETKNVRKVWKESCKVLKCFCVVKVE